MISVKRYKVKWTKHARADIFQIIHRIAVQHPLSAKKIYQRIKILAQKLDHYPMRGRVVPELKEYSITTYQELIHDPWRIIYSIVQDTVYISAIIDSRRNIEDILLARLVEVEL